MARIIARVKGCSIEVSARDPLAGNALAPLAASLAAVYVTWTPSDTHHGIVGAAVQLKRAGFTPVPHIAARALASFTQLNDCLRRLAGEAGVDRALVVGGDLDRPVGPFASALELLATGLFQKHSILNVGIAAYPEGHPKIARRALDRALGSKLALLERQGIAAHIVTQFGFEAGPILDWLRQTRALGIAVPVRIGLAGPASIATLAKFAVRCGIGHSLQALTRGHASVARLLIEAGPEAIVTRLALADGDELRDAGLHFFTFGGVRRTALWTEAVLRGNFAMSEDGNGFRVTLA